MATLTRHEIAWVRNGLVWGTGRVIEYRIEGPSPDDEAFIANFGSRNHDSWKVLRVKDGADGDWTGDYGSADEAFAVLQQPVMD
jgi:hypothetical protein